MFYPGLGIDLKLIGKATVKSQSYVFLYSTAYLYNVSTMRLANKSLRDT
jgi:hypothetical protein